MTVCQKVPGSRNNCVRPTTIKPSQIPTKRPVSARQYLFALRMPRPHGSMHGIRLPQE